jgi:hypothetical protein
MLCSWYWVHFFLFFCLKSWPYTCHLLYLICKAYFAHVLRKCLPDIHIWRTIVCVSIILSSNYSVPWTNIPSLSQIVHMHTILQNFSVTDNCIMFYHINAFVYSSFCYTENFLKCVLKIHLFNKNKKYISLMKINLFAA